MLESTDLKEQQHRRYMEIALNKAENNLLGLKGQVKMTEDYVAWLRNELGASESDTESPKT